MLDELKFIMGIGAIFLIVTGGTVSAKIAITGYQNIDRIFVVDEVNNTEYTVFKIFVILNIIIFIFICGIFIYDFKKITTSVINRVFQMDFLDFAGYSILVGVFVLFILGFIVILRIAFKGNIDSDALRVTNITKTDLILLKIFLVLDIFIIAFFIFFLITIIESRSLENKRERETYRY